MGQALCWAVFAHSRLTSKTDFRLHRSCGKASPSSRYGTFFDKGGHLGHRSFLRQLHLQKSAPCSAGRGLQGFPVSNVLLLPSSREHSPPSVLGQQTEAESRHPPPHAPPEAADCSGALGLLDNRKLPPACEISLRRQKASFRDVAIENSASVSNILRI